MNRKHRTALFTLCLVSMLLLTGYVPAGVDMPERSKQPAGMARIVSPVIALEPPVDDELARIVLIGDFDIVRVPLRKCKASGGCE